MKGGVRLTEPSDFGVFLKKKRKAANLTQNDLAVVINKSGQYISNIEKGKNNAPPNLSDLDLPVGQDDGEGEAALWLPSRNERGEADESVHRRDERYADAGAGEQRTAARP